MPGRIIFDADDPLVLDGTYDREGYKPGERARIAKAHAAQSKGLNDMSKKPNGGVPRGRKSAKPTKRKQSRKAVEKVLSGLHKSPRSEPLPGFEQVRAVALDRLCEGIGDCRDQMNTARTEEQGLIKAALQQMVKRNVSVYKHAGIELARVPGAEKLRVRVTKETGDADDTDLESGDEVDVEDEVDPVFAASSASEDTPV